MAAGRLRRALGIAGDGSEAIAAVLRVHPAFVPGYARVGVDRRLADDRVRLWLEDCDAFHEGDAYSWYALLGDAPHPALDAMVQAVNPRARCVPAPPSGRERLAWDIVIDAPRRRPSRRPRSRWSPARARRPSCSVRSTARPDGGPLASPAASLAHVGGSRLLAFADAVFGRDDEAADQTGHWLVRYLCVAAILSAVIIARRPDTVTNPQFWGEDAFVFFRQNLTFGFPRAVTTFYANFPYLGQRLVAFAGGLVPLAAAPRVYASAAIAITALCVGTFSLPAFRHLVRSDLLRVLWAVAVVSLPLQDSAAGPGVLATLANLGWWVAIWVALLSLVRLPAQPGRVMLLALGGALAVFSTPHAVVCAPLWLLRAWRAIQRRDRWELAFALALVIALALCFLLTGNLGANVQGTLHLSFFSMPSVYLERYVALVSDRVAALVLGSATLAAVRTAGAGATAAVALAVLVCLLAAALVGRRGVGQTILVAAYLYLASLFLSTMGRLVFAVLPLESFPTRYTIPSSAMLLLAIVIALDGLPRGRSRRGAILVATAILAWSLGSRIGVAPFLDQRWPQYAALLDQKLRAGSHGAVHGTDESAVDSARARRARTRPAASPAGEPSHRGVRPRSTVPTDVHQSLRRSRRDRPAPRRGDIREPGTDRALARRRAAADRRDEQRATRRAAPGCAAALLLPPIAGSAGRRYTIVLQATETDPAHPIMVVGAMRDPYPEGRAIVEGATPDTGRELRLQLREHVDRCQPLTERGGQP